MLIYTCTQLQTPKLQMQPNALYGSDLSLAKATCFNFGINNHKGYHWCVLWYWSLQIMSSNSYVVFHITTFRPWNWHHHAHTPEDCHLGWSGSWYLQVGQKWWGLWIFIFKTHPINLQKQHFQVRNILTLELNTDNQGGHFPPTRVPPLVYFHIRSSCSCPGNRLNL